MNQLFFKRFAFIILSVLLIISTYSFYILPDKLNSSLKKKDNLSPEDDEYANDDFLRYDDYTYDDSIKTVLLYNYKDQLLPPIISLDGKEHLTLSFDDLRTDFEDYNYTVIHCNADWTPSELAYNEYIDGFFEMNIIN